MTLPWPIRPHHSHFAALSEVKRVVVVVGIGRGQGLYAKGWLVVVIGGVFVGIYMCYVLRLQCVCQRCGLTNVFQPPLLQ